ncbi:hypothetical protein V1523DRAFT_421588 [Lipomyces doorenjongii]
MTVASVVRVGLIGCGEVSPVIHIPKLSLLSDSFQLTYLCDVSEQSLCTARKRSRLA